MILPSTATKNNGWCALCRRKETWAEDDAQREAARAKTPSSPFPQMLKEYPSAPYEKWSEASHARWIDAGHTFGTHLMKYVRDKALQTLPEDTPETTKQAVAEATRVSLGAMMALLDGVYRCDVGSHHTIEYALMARVKDNSGSHIEEIELSPDGDGLGMGFTGWWQNEFWRNKQ